MLRYIIIIAVCILEATAQTSNKCKSGPPKGTSPSGCCHKANSFDQAVFDKCFSQFGNSPPRPGSGLQGPMNGLECVFECVLNSTRAYENGKINPQLLTQKISANLTSTQEWVPVVTAGINFCAGQITSNAAQLRNSLKGGQINGKSICSPNAAFFYGCLFTYEFRNCPTRVWNGTRECNELKNYFNQCTIPLLNL